MFSNPRNQSECLPAHAFPLLEIIIDSKRQQKNKRAILLVISGAIHTYTDSWPLAFFQSLERLPM